MHLKTEEYQKRNKIQGRTETPLWICCVCPSIWYYQWGGAETWNEIPSENSEDGNSSNGQTQPLLCQQETSTSKTRFQGRIRVHALVTVAWLAKTRGANNTYFRMLSFYFLFFFPQLVGCFAVAKFLLFPKNLIFCPLKQNWRKEVRKWWGN